MEINTVHSDEFPCVVCKKEIEEGHVFIEIFTNNGIREETGGGYIPGNRKVWDRGTSYAHMSHFLNPFKTPSTRKGSIE